MLRKRDRNPGPFFFFHSPTPAYLLMITAVPEDPSTWQNPDFVAKFLQNVRGAIPLTIEQIDIMLQLITVARGERIGAFLDLGCGDGVLAAAILDEHPEA